MADNDEKKPVVPTEVKDRDAGEPTGSLTEKLALGPTPTLAPAVNPLAGGATTPPAQPATPSAPPQAAGLPRLAQAPGVKAPQVTPAPQAPGDVQTQLMEKLLKSIQTPEESAAERKKNMEAYSTLTTQLNDKLKELDVKENNKRAEIAGLPEHPKLKTLPYQQPKPVSLEEQWGSSAMMFAMLGSLFTRGHAVTALNAAAAAMKGFKEGNQDLAKAEYEKWKTATENLKLTYNYEKDTYDAIIKKHIGELSDIKDAKKDAMEMAKFEMQAFAKATGNDAAANSRDFREMIQILALQQRTAHQENQDALALSKNVDTKMQAAEIIKMMGQDDFKTANAQERRAKFATLGIKKGANKELDELMDNAIKEAAANEPFSQAELARASKIAHGLEGLPPLSRNMTDAQQQRIIRAAQSINPEFDPVRGVNLTNIIKQYDNPNSKASHGRLSLNTAADHLVEFKPIIEALNNGDYTAVNKLMNQFGYATGGQEVTDFNTVRDILADEMTKVLLGSAGALTDREEMKSLLNNANAEGQLLSSVGQMIKLIGDRAKNMELDYVHATQRTPEDYMRGLNENVTKLFGDKLGAVTSKGGENKGTEAKGAQTKNESATIKKKIGDAVYQGTNKFRVTEIDENGNPTAAVPWTE